MAYGTRSASIRESSSVPQDPDQPGPVGLPNLPGLPNPSGLPNLPGPLNSSGQPDPSSQLIVGQPSSSQASFSGQTGTPTLMLTQEQANARFAMEQRKAEAEIRAIEAAIARDNAAAEAKAIRDKEESQAKITALTSGATTSDSNARKDAEEPIGEIPREALLVSNQFPGLPQGEIAKIFLNKFRPENLYKLRHLQGREDKDSDENIVIKNGRMKLEKATGTYRDFGTTWDIWSEAFANYAAIMVDFFGVAFPHLHRALHHFQLKIRQLSRIYEWQNACLPLALDFHSERTTLGPTNVDAWKLPAHWIDSFCTPQYVRPTSKK